MIFRKSSEGFCNGSVVVAHPGTQYSYETVLAVQEAELLQWYITGFFYKPEGLLGRWVRLFPDNFRFSLERELRRRYKDGLDPNRVRTFPAAELLYLVAGRLGLPRRYGERLLRWRNERFDDLVGHVVARERPTALICYDSCALKVFKRAKSLGILCILDQSIAHIRSGLKLLREEAELHPDFADSLPMELPDWLIERCSEEATIADRVLAASVYVKESLIEHGVDPSRVVIMPYGADIGSSSPLRQQDDSVFRLLFVGQISQRKGIKYLLEAVKQLNMPGMELLLVGGIVGSGIGLAAYRDCFTHIPHVPHHEVHTYFQKGDVFLCPSLHEGSAIAIYEALASGLPVITTPNSGSVVRDGIEGFIVPIRHVEGLKEKILLLYENRELREEMSQNARKRAKEYTWQAYRQRMGAFLHELLSGRETGGASCLAAV
jgi:alpha-maltose-1-phosphate synthase